MNIGRVAIKQGLRTIKSAYHFNGRRIFYLDSEQTLRYFRQAINTTQPSRHGASHAGTSC